MRGDKPFPRVVVPTDGSRLSQSAAHAAAELARRACVPLTLFGVAKSQHERDDLGNELDEMITALRSELVVDFLVDVVNPAAMAGGDVADTILDEAAVDGALVCMASHGRTGLGAALLGSVTEEVLRRSPRPVLVVGPRYRSCPWRSDGMVVACVDGSSFAEIGVTVAEEWSATFDAQLWLVQVAPPRIGRAPDGGSSRDCFETGYLRHLTRFSSGVNYDVTHSHHPARELVDLAHRWPINLMVIATHGRSGWSRLTLGSVAMDVVHHATCPVLLVGRNEARRNGEGDSFGFAP